MSRDWRWEWQMLFLDVQLFVAKVKTAFYQIKRTRVERRSRILALELALLRARTEREGVK